MEAEKGEQVSEIGREVTLTDGPPQDEGKCGVGLGQGGV